MAKINNDAIIFSNPIYHAIFDWIWIEKQLKEVNRDSLEITSEDRKNQSDIMRSKPIDSFPNKTYDKLLGNNKQFISLSVSGIPR